jgi:hypothetical protein
MINTQSNNAFRYQGQRRCTVSEPPVNRSGQRWLLLGHDCTGSAPSVNNSRPLAKKLVRNATRRASITTTLGRALGVEYVLSALPIHSNKESPTGRQRKVAQAVRFAGSSSFEWRGKRRGFLKYEGNSMVHQCERGIAGVRSTGYDRQPLSSPFKEGIADRSPEEGGAGSVVRRFLFIRIYRKTTRVSKV